MRDDRYRRRVISKKQNRGYIIYQPNGLMHGSEAKRGGFDAKGTVNTPKSADNHLKEIKELQDRKMVLN